MEKDQTKQDQQTEQASDSNLKPRSGAFNETRQGDEKSTTNMEQEAALEQERKEALTERD